MLSKLFTDDDDCGRFPVRSRQGSNYIMIAYHHQSNATLSAPFKSRADKHRLQACNSIMQCLKDRNINMLVLVDLQILDNEASKEYKYKRTIRGDWGVQFQLEPPHKTGGMPRSGPSVSVLSRLIFSSVSGSFPIYLFGTCFCLKRS